MSKIAIVTDSTSYIPEDLRKQQDICMIPLNVVFGEETYKEEIDITFEDFYYKMQQQEQLPTTSQPSIGLFEETFRDLGSDFDEIIVITLSSGISGTYQTAVSAAHMYEDLPIHVFDTETSCLIQGFYALEAAKMVKNKASSKEILERLEALKQSTRAYFMADDLSHLHRGGRLNGAQLFIGSMLQIKPVLHFENKMIVPYEKVRTEKKAVAKIKSLLEEDLDSGKGVSIAVIHGNCEEKAEKIKQELEEKYPDATIYLSYFGPVIGAHLGPGSLGIGWMKA
ncbi:DegV family protein [Alkalicoccus daliensis]|uniref:EDD domain protein, DegV family n=1 Tax=Alkalicoccus daliensis TaxID=745820 RepID=A0A1H0J2F7_9BACI|nr:DegV family protein [Alkalicoccus daliensis]SDO37629.1 EDD domain protein, DegV family [Alkalicoccus daliensis]